MVSAQGKASVQKSAYLEGFGNVIDQGEKDGIFGNGVDKRAPPGFDVPQLYGTSYQGVADVNSKAPWLEGKEDLHRKEDFSVIFLMQSS